MGANWLPLKDQDLLTWVTIFSSLITAAPTTYGLVAADATALAALVTAYNTALTAATNPSTRTEVTIAAKDVAKAGLLASVRGLAKRIQAVPSVTPAQKLSLGLPIHKTTQTPIPPPVTRPVLSVVGGSVGKTLTIRLVDETTPTKKAKPFGVDGAAVYSYVPTGSENPPADLELWRFEGIATKSVFEAGFNPSDVGKTAYVKARWFNPRGEAGPASDDVTATIAA
jgi:hypothetical protein